MKMLAACGLSAIAATLATQQAQAVPTDAMLAPPPAVGSPLDKADHEIFEATRALKGTRRWTLATQDADLKPAALLKDFSCAAGFEIDAARAPHLVALIKSLQAQAKAAVSADKVAFARVRPFVGNDAPICTPRKPNAKSGFAYPSGHTTNGWSSALLLSRLLPEREAEILRRGRVIGESRIVCGVHWASDVTAGYQEGASVFARFETDPSTAAEIEAARAELAALKKTAPAPDGERCAIELDAAEHSPFTQP
ncbi:acid phosphatase [Acidomonas methanolica]|nr:phosphatase PAP2 family protein [Acidomonas methanolica]MBU2654887.1 phosphatase PAP2 family protein [Acidomonas methanolica]